MQLQSQEDENHKAHGGMDMNEEAPHAYHIVDGEHHYLAMAANDQGAQHQMDGDYIQLRESQDKEDNQYAAFQKLIQ